MSNFELAADAIVSGDIDTLTRLLDASPEFIHERSTREHGCTLLIAAHRWKSSIAMVAQSWTRRCGPLTMANRKLILFQ